jgi:hypothetical protein
MDGKPLTQEQKGHGSWFARPWFSHLASVCLTQTQSTSTSNSSVKQLCPFIRIVTLTFQLSILYGSECNVHILARSKIIHLPMYVRMTSCWRKQGLEIGNQNSKSHHWMKMCRGSL